MPNGERSANSGGPPRVISPDTSARPLRSVKPYWSMVSWLQTMTSLSSAVDGVRTCRLSGSTSPSSATCSSTLVASASRFGSSWRSTNDSNELVYSGSRSISPVSMAA